MDLEPFGECKREELGVSFFTAPCKTVWEAIILKRNKPNTAIEGAQLIVLLKETIAN